MDIKRMSEVLALDEPGVRFVRLLNSYCRLVMTDMTTRMFENAIKVTCKTCLAQFAISDTVFKPIEVEENGGATYVAAYVCRECNKPQEVIDFVKGSKSEPWR